MSVQFLTLCRSCADMVLNVEKRNKLVELVARCKDALADAGTSAPTSTPPLVAASAPNSSELAHVDNKRKRVVVETSSEDEDTCTSLVFKDKGWTMSWHHRTLPLIATPHPSGTTP